MAIEFGQVLDNLYVGSCPENTADIDRLRHLEIDAVLNIQTDLDIESECPDWTGLQDCYSANEITLCRTPIRDFDILEMMDKLAGSVEALKSLLDEGHTVYVHCTHGWNRSPTVVIAYLHWYMGWSLERAELHLLQCKDCGPNTELVRRLRTSS